MSEALAIVEDLLQEQHYKLSSTQVNLPPDLADFVIQWGRINIPDEHLYYDDKGGMGREDEIHIMVLYGLTDKEPSPELLKLVRETPPFTARLTGITLFDNNPDYDVVKFDVECEELEALSNAIRQVCPNENKYPKYIPHCTVAYVKKGRVPDLAGQYPFESDPLVPAEFEVNEIIFKPAGESGDPNRKPIHIPLNRYTKEAEDPKQVFQNLTRPEQVLKDMGFTQQPDGEWQRLNDRVFTKVNRDDSRKAFLCDFYVWAVNKKEWVNWLPNQVWREGKGSLRQYIEDAEAGIRAPWNARFEAESPQSALGILKITRPMRFRHVPEGFYFRTPHYELVRKVYDEETRANAVTNDLDMVRTMIIPDDYWCFPPKYTVNDITSGPVREAAEDPKSVLRLAKAALGRWVVSRVTDAYGNPLRDVHYLDYQGKGGFDSPDIGSWTPLWHFATQFKSPEDAWEAVRRCFGDDQSYWQGGVDTQILNPRDNDDSKLAQLEAEDPKSVLRAARSLNHVPVCPISGSDILACTRHDHVKDIEAWQLSRRERIQARDAENLAWRSKQQRAQRMGEAEDPKQFLQLMSKCDQLTVHWLDQFGKEHRTTYFDLPKAEAEEELKRNLVINKSPYTVSKILGLYAQRLEGKERSPFDLLGFPTDASVLARKLLDLDTVEKPTVL